MKAREYAKDMSLMREMDATKDQRDKRKGILRDHSLQHHVQVEWDISDDAMRDHMFRLKVDDYEVILDSEEMMRYLRWV